MSTELLPLRLCDLRPFQFFQGATFALVEKKMRLKRDGGSYLWLKVRDCTGEVAGKWFSPPADIQSQLKEAQLVRVSGQVDGSDSYRGELKIQALEVAALPDDLTPFLPPLPRDHRAHLARFGDLVRSVNHPHLKALLKEVFGEQRMSRFCIAPAAAKMHHAYRGGLLEHCGEVAVLCDRNAATLPHLNRDLLVTAALLHDIGKLEEMECDLSAGTYTHAGHLVGHVVLGTCLVASCAERVEGFPCELKHALMHLILSHHGRLEHGAAKTPMCAEAVVLSLCDLMSAKLAQCRDAACGQGEDFGQIYGWDERVYLGLMREMMEEGAA